jgi:hypothetical protein
LTPLVTLVCGDGADQDAAALAAESVPDDFHPTDLLHLAPAGVRWTVEEVGRVHAATSKPPVGAAGAVVIASVDRMAPGSFDHLLVLLERPPAGWRFFLTAAGQAGVPTTLRSRVGATSATRTQARREAGVLAAAGCRHPAAAAAAISSCSWLAEAVTDSPETAAALAGVCAPQLPSEAPATLAADLADGVAALASSAPANLRGQVARAAAAAVLAVWRQDLVAAAAVLPEPGKVAEALGQAHRLLRLNVEPVVPIALVATAYPPSPRYSRAGRGQQA